MSDDDRKHALELRVAHARERLHRRIETLEERGRSVVHAARMAAQAAAVVVLGLGGIGTWLVWRGLTHGRTQRRGEPIAAQQGLALRPMPWLLLAVVGLGWTARRTRELVSTQRAPRLLPSDTRALANAPHESATATPRVPRPERS